MPVYRFLSVVPVSPGQLESFVLNFPGDRDAAEAYVRDERIGAPNEYRIAPKLTDAESKQPVMLCEQYKRAEQSAEGMAGTDADLSEDLDDDFLQGDPL